MAAGVSYVQFYPGLTFIELTVSKVTIVFVIFTAVVFIIAVKHIHKLASSPFTVRPYHTSCQYLLTPP